MNRTSARIWLLAAASLFLFAGLAHAQSSLGLGNAEPGAGPPSGLIALYAPWFQSLLSWINTEQQGFYRLLTGSLKAMRENPFELWGLIGLSFVYGVFHAAGPGHGKAVISSYMIANETELKRGVVISFLSALVQGGVAVLMVAAGFLLLHGTAVTMTDAAKWLETVSFAAITVFGLYLLYRKLGPKFRYQPHSVPLVEPGLALAGGPDHRQLHHHDHHDHHHHDHGVGEVCETCGHAHAPAPEMLKGDDFTLRDAWAAIAAVGMRPCSGALIVLTFSFFNGLYLGGILSVLAMSIGTAITVSILATLAVTAKGWAMRRAGAGAAGLRVGSMIEIGGAIAVTLFGLTLFLASLQA
jgi:ABC-type nickel/cobalt efflux system permease component RcnA